MSSSDWVSGQWRSMDRVLALLQTYDTDTLCRKRLYRDIMEIRPEQERIEVDLIDLYEPLSVEEQAY